MKNISIISRKRFKHSLFLGALLVAGFGFSQNISAASIADLPTIRDDGGLIPPAPACNRTIEDGWHPLLSKMSTNLAVTITANNGGNANYIDLRNFTGASNQYFYFEYDATKGAYQIKAYSTIYGNTVLSFSSENGVVQLLNNTNSNNQYWIISGDGVTGYTIKNYAKTNYNLSIDRGIAQAGIGILTSEQNYSNSQSFNLK
ncbi:MAG: RICIN domain-containing protein [Lactococcus cremoris]